jgi:phage shock protein PspC (stress-responsive transcriptional regulator)
LQRFFYKVLFYFELKSFGVCQWWARKLGIQIHKVRLGFIYFAFIGLGSPVLLYLIMAWLLEHKHYFKFLGGQKRSIWEIE